MIKEYVTRLADYKLFAVSELAMFSSLSEYKVRSYVPAGALIRAKFGVYPRHLDHLMRMVDNPEFSRIHAKTLVEDGATVAGLARVSGESESNLRRWAEGVN